MFIELTDYETGELILVDPETITLVWRFPARTYTIAGSDLPPIENGARTKVVADMEMLVRETTEEIRDAIVKATGGETL